MSRRRRDELRASSYGASPTRVAALVRELERGERLRRTLALSGPLLGAALVSLFIPAWHFVGVPGFLIAAIVLGRRRLAEHTQVEALSGPCPACGAEHAYPPPSPYALPVTLRCPGCGEFVKLEPAAS